MIDNQEAVKVIDANRGDGVIIATMNANNVRFGLPTVTTQEQLDMPVSGAMGKAANVGLGLALAQPNRKVIVLDGDGSLLMNLGAMVTLANKTPKNLCHMVFDNGVYAVTGGQPVPGSGKADWEGLAKAAGYAATFSFDNLEDLTTGIAEAMAATGPVFVHLQVTPQIENTPVQFRQRGRRSMQTAIDELPEIFAKA
ncbi:Phosphonopyruvate decarboxylase [Geodia barretti]|uniref:2-hydroxyacyl-CoA lyase 2 n=1 Tax=Geodia barretti TaxID=519541 RepID=A0AA35WW85_GEOBA|nr:Phosphonopyruvate decarboxylase [Geodia barretti]